MFQRNQRTVESVSRPAHLVVLLSDAVAQLGLTITSLMRTALLSLQPLPQLGSIHVGGVQLPSEHLDLCSAHVACVQQGKTLIKKLRASNKSLHNSHLQAMPAEQPDV